MGKWRPDPLRKQKLLRLLFPGHEIRELASREILIGPQNGDRFHCVDSRERKSELERERKLWGAGSWDFLRKYCAALLAAVLSRNFGWSEEGTHSFALGLSLCCDSSEACTHSEHGTEKLRRYLHR